MKACLILSLLLSGVSLAGFETWTSKDGKTAEMELVNVMTLGGTKVGEFKTKAGKTVSLRADQLSEADAARLND